MHELHRIVLLLCLFRRLNSLALKVNLIIKIERSLVFKINLTMKIVLTTYFLNTDE